MIEEGEVDNLKRTPERGKAITNRDIANRLKFNYSECMNKIAVY